MIDNNRPIGVFDSGLGGLTAVRQLIKILPNEDIVYLGDTARVPYGNKSKKAIIKFSTQNTLYLLKFKVKLIVLACNTSSSFALNRLKYNFKIPILGVITPGVKAALEVTRNKRIGIIGTNVTIDSNAYQNKIINADPSIKIFAKSCPLFVPIIEEGWLSGKITSSVIRKYLMPLKNAKIDTLILGCTHYPLLKPAIRNIMGPGVKLIDSAKELAISVKQLMDKEGIACKRKTKGKARFYLSDKPYRFKSTGEKFLGQEMSHVFSAKESELG